ncbi:MAG: DUF4189 domain-containing protein [Candidatus Hydrogenedentes bacterium]|nr:DUF4189 domain-containing protein [Candidatus Hydrogenedentota bacterium]
MFASMRNASRKFDGVSLFAVPVAALVCVAIAATQVWAANSIWQDSNDASIWGVGVGTTGDAARAAGELDCKSRGGTDCNHRITRVDTLGWGAIAQDNSGHSGITWEKASRKKAKKQAKKTCKNAGGTNCKVVRTFYDPYSV